MAKPKKAKKAENEAPERDEGPKWRYWHETLGRQRILDHAGGELIQQTIQHVLMEVLVREGLSEDWNHGLIQRLMLDSWGVASAWGNFCAALRCPYGFRYDFARDWLDRFTEHLADGLWSLVARHHRAHGEPERVWQGHADRVRSSFSSMCA